MLAVLASAATAGVRSGGVYSLTAGISALRRKEYELAASELEKGLDDMATPGHPHAHRIDEEKQLLIGDARTGLIRALRKLGQNDKALEQVAVLKAEAEVLPIAQRRQVRAKLAAESATILACAGRIAEAVDTKKDALLELDEMLQAVAGTQDAPEQENRFAIECAELARLLRWAGAADEADQTAVSSMMRNFLF